MKALLVAVAALAACTDPAARPSADAAACAGTAETAGGPFRLDGAAAKVLVAGGAKLVDVRSPAFYNRGHIEGAINIPWAQMEARAAEIGPADAKVVVYCRTGEGSGKAAATLVRLGYRHVYDLGSYLNWGEGAPKATALPPTN